MAGEREAGIEAASHELPWEAYLHVMEARPLSLSHSPSRLEESLPSSANNKECHIGKTFKVPENLNFLKHAKFEDGT